MIFSAICNISISRLSYDVNVRLSVRLSVTEVHWRIIANLGFKFRSHFTVLLAGGSYRAMLASARSLVFNFLDVFIIVSNPTNKRSHYFAGTLAAYIVT